MAQSIIDLNAIASQVYNNVMQMNKMASDLVGLDSIYCRLVPEENSEDVIVQEYTLFGYECPKNIKVVTSNTDYQAGNFMIDAWGIHQDVPLEINIDITTWNSIYGENTMPQKGDFILIQLLRQPYEVISSQIIKTIGEQPTSFKCMLGVWKHASERKEPEAFKISIDELTVNQEDMFGEAISREVADAVVEVETSYNTTTNVDPMKTADLDSVQVADDMQGVDGNTFATAYYSFVDMDMPITYNVSATYNPSAEANHWIFSCWFKTDDGSDDIQSGSLKIGELYLKEKDFWYFNISSGMKIYEGDRVSIYRGASIKLNGVIVQEPSNKSFAIKIATSDCLKTSAKIANWWKSGIWKIQKQTSFNMLCLNNNNDSKVLTINLTGNEITLRVNGLTKNISISKGKALSFDDWHYMAVDMTSDSVNTILVRNKLASSNKYTNKVIVNDTQKINISGFSFDCAEIDNVGMDFCMTNMRLYENHVPLGDNYKLDMYSQVTKNASKLIFVDSPTASNKMACITPIR